MANGFGSTTSRHADADNLWWVEIVDPHGVNKTAAAAAPRLLRRWRLRGSTLVQLLGGCKAQALAMKTTPKSRAMFLMAIGLSFTRGPAYVLEDPSILSAEFMPRTRFRTWFKAKSGLIAQK